MSSLYNVVFKGQLIEGFDLDSVKLAFAQAFKLDTVKSEKFFTGKPVVIKKSIDQEKAHLYRKRLAKFGALVELHQLDMTSDTAKTETKSSLADTQKRTREDVISRIQKAKQTERKTNVTYDFSDLEYRPPNRFLQLLGYSCLAFSIADFCLNWMGIINLTGFNWAPLVSVLVGGLALKFSRNES